MQKQINILIIDDMRVNILAVSKILFRYGFNVMGEQDPLKAFEAISKLKPDIIILDYEMPNLNGVELCKELKNNRETFEIPVLFITGLTGEKEIESAFDAGAEDYVLKPAREKELISRINRILTNKRLNSKLKNQFDDQSILNRVLSHDLNNLLALIYNGTSLSKRSLQKFLESKNETDLLNCQKGLDTIDNTSKRINSLLKNIREMQLQENDQINLKLELINFEELLNESLLLLKDKIDSKSIQIENKIPKDLFILADKSSLLNSVINNILTNAIKFSNQNSKIQIDSQENDYENTIVFKDFGIGMNQKIIDNLFSKTANVSRMGTANEKGTGFGMHIIKKYMELYEGDIKVTSKSIEEYPAESGTTVLLHFKKSIN